MFMFFYNTKKVQIKQRSMLEEVSIADIPYIRVENRFPAYDDWYAEEKENLVIIYRRSSELFPLVRDGRGMTNYEYYYNYYSMNGKNNRLIKREYTYELVKMFSEKLKNNNNVNINLLEIDVDYEIDDFYVNVDNWGILKWGD
ncbi:hypothetical protein [Clostridium butyricum]|uniref:hypothetical protein n=3 Tax=Clostridium butyricum TaxID=1492 RepID=UPI002AB2C625|nr:hypothetical protein [Clostridium butyricum]